MEKDLTKYRPKDLAMDQGMHYLDLNDPKTGLITDSTLTLEARWLLQAIVNSIIRAKGNEIFTYSDGSFDPLTFRITSTEIRKATKEEFTNARQLKAFKELRQWLLIYHYEWIEETNQHGRWQQVKAERAKPFLVDSVILEAKPLGTLRKSDQANSQVEFWGYCNPMLARVLQSNVYFQKIHLIPPGACNHKRGAQLILHQALPFVFRPSGFHLEFEFACNLLDFSAATRGVPKYCCRLIDRYTREVALFMAWRWGATGDGSKRVWSLYAGKQCPVLDV
jgi:hypothetical protein